MIKRLLMCVALLGFHVTQSKELRFDWHSINTGEIYFPKDFLWGAAICEYQTSGADYCPDSQWAQWEKSYKLTPSGGACQSWDRYPQDIACLQEMGLKAYRFSVDWSCIEPQEGHFNEAALQHYVDLCNALRAAGITPLVTLHHFVHPQWFEDKGGFEHEENTKYFVRFCEHVFKRLRSHVRFWCTINEPTIYVFQGYIRGVFPPGKSGISGMKQAGRVLKHLLDAHIEVYQKLKSMPGGNSAQIGFAHSYLMFEKFHGWWSPVKSVIEGLVSSILSTFLNDSVIEYFTRGKFRFYVPGVVDEQAFNRHAFKALDYIGINYYSHVLMRIHHRLYETVHTGYRPEDIPTDMPYAIYAEGLYRAIEHMAQLKVPMYITENGIPDGRDDRRDTWIRRYLYALSKALADGYDVRGYFYWSLMNNYEWDMGYTMKFGLFDVDFTTQKRTMYPGSQWLKHVVAQSRSSKAQA